MKGLFLGFLRTPRFVWHVAECLFLFADSLVYVTRRCAAVHQMALSNWGLFLGCFVADADWHITAHSNAARCIPSRSPAERGGRKPVAEAIAVQSTSLTTLFSGSAARNYCMGVVLEICLCFPP